VKQQSPSNLFCHVRFSAMLNRFFQVTGCHSASMWGTVMPYRRIVFSRILQLSGSLLTVDVCNEGKHEINACGYAGRCPDVSVMDNVFFNDGDVPGCPQTVKGVPMSSSLLSRQ